MAEAVATITLNRPAHRNRLHNEDLALLLEHFARIDADPSIQVTVLTGKVVQPRPVFCAGYHIGEFGEAREPEVSFEGVAQALERLRPITICALPGSVYGGATDLALACDFRLGVQGMEMHMPAGALGIHYYPQRHASLRHAHGTGGGKEGIPDCPALVGRGPSRRSVTSTRSGRRTSSRPRWSRFARGSARWRRWRYRT